MPQKMEVNWFIVGIVILVALLIVIFTIRKNWREKKKLEKFLNEKDLEKK